MSAQGHILFRADADEHIGSGHVMRCFALAQAAIDAGMRATLLTAPTSPHLAERFQAEGVAVVSLTATPAGAGDAIETAALAHRCEAGMIVLDGYAFNAVYQRTLRSAGHPVMYVDDHAHLSHYAVDVLFNQNVYANPAMYPELEPDAELLLGSAYCLLRRDFRKCDRLQRTIPDIARHVLVTMGGADPHNTTSTVIDALSALDAESRIRVLLGGSNRYGNDVECAIDRAGLKSVEVLRDVRDMPAQMAWADLAITSASSTCWELACMGVPMVAVTLAENQEPIAEALEQRGIALNAGWHDRLDTDRLRSQVGGLVNDAATRSRMSSSGQGLVDGKGAERVLKALQSRMNLQRRSPSPCA